MKMAGSNPGHFCCVSIVDGAIIMSKTLNDPSRLERQILIFRSCVKLMFAAPPSP
jgi:TetR/AcrR family transcriptional regulator, transcriptional repressor for nem operon